MKKITIFIVIGMGILLLCRNLYVQTENKTVKTKYPIDKIEVEKDVIKIFLSENAKLNEIVNLHIFKGLHPGMSNQEITNIIGNTSDTSNRFDSKFLVYYTDKGRIETGVTTGVLTNDQFYSTSICMFYKQDFSSNFLFKTSILQYIPEDITNRQIGVFVKGSCNFVINLSNEEEDWIQWMKDYGH